MQEDDELIEALTRLALEPKTKKALLRYKEYEAQVAGQEAITLKSWRMQDFAYKTEPCPFPTRARGLFTVDEPLRDGRRIVVRGYDKFFNVGEVSWTKWEAIANHARGPYYLTVKSNGCIIFISALSPTDLIVTSKHSLGDEENKLLHAIKGNEWLDKCLQSVHKSRQGLAAVLWENRWTAVAELCDDSFEEHVLAYTPEETGLHLHGINLNSRKLSSLEPAKVATFAREWGFIETKYLVMDVIEQVKSFTDNCSNDDGRWNGKHVEGFVVRSHNLVQDSPEASSGDTFMFKVKFEQPYLRWRQWRELTRKMLSHVKKSDVDIKDDNTLLGVRLDRLKEPSTRAYAIWAAEQIQSNPASFEDWKESRGIVATRDRFLDFYRSKEAETLRERDRTKTDSPPKDYDRTLLITIAVPGCGKTLMSVALSHLFGFAHTQSDDVQAKSTKKLFLQNVTNLLKTESVLIADRNNHQIQHRDDLLKAIASPALREHQIKTIALVWDVDAHPFNTIHRICADRIVTRGEAHQSLRADETDERKHESILNDFMTSRQAFDPVLNGETDGQIDNAILIDPTLEPRAMLKSISENLSLLLGLERPDKDEIDLALQKAQEYRPTLRKDVKVATKPARYYGIAVESNLEDLISQVLKVRGIECEIWTALRESDRIERRPHITILHSKNKPPQDAGDSEKQDFDEFWSECKTLVLQGVDFAVIVGPRLMWNDRVMTLEVSEIRPTSKLNAASHLEKDTAHRHITVGTRDREITGYEGRLLMEKVQRGEKEGCEIIDIGTHKLQGRIKGLS